MSWDQVRATCPIVRDTVEGDPHEDLPQHVLSILVGTDTVRAILDDTGFVHRLEVASPHLRTREGWGVGVSLQTLLRNDSVKAYAGWEMELAFYVAMPSHCGVAFRIPWQGTGDPLPDSVDVRYLRKLPPSLRVTNVYVHGCH
jgi:hypothetical protein